MGWRCLGKASTCNAAIGSSRSVQEEATVIAAWGTHKVWCTLCLLIIPLWGCPSHESILKVHSVNWSAWLLATALYEASRDCLAAQLQWAKCMHRDDKSLYYGPDWCIWSENLCTFTYTQCVHFIHSDICIYAKHAQVPTSFRAIIQIPRHHNNIFSQTLYKMHLTGVLWAHVYIGAAFSDAVVRATIILSVAGNARNTWFSQLLIHEVHCMRCYVTKVNKTHWGESINFGSPNDA